MRRLLPAVSCMILIVLLSARATVAAEERMIVDEGNFFSPQAITAAEQMFREAKERYGLDVAVLTFLQVPADKQDELKTKGKERFYAEWLNELARTRHVQGIVILLSDKPGHLEVGVQNKLLVRQFTPRDRDELRDLMLSRFKVHEFDRGLQEGARFIVERLGANQQPGAGDRNERPTTRPATQPATRPAEYQT